MVVALSAVNDLLGWITGGTLGGLPTIAVMAVPFIVGIVVGFFVRKLLKWAVIFGILAVVLAYFGFFGLSLESLKDLAITYSPAIYHYGVLLFGLLPLGLGFLLGLVIGFLIS